MQTLVQDIPPSNWSNYYLQRAEKTVVGICRWGFLAGGGEALSFQHYSRYSKDTHPLGIGRPGGCPPPPNERVVNARFSAPPEGWDLGGGGPRTNIGWDDPTSVRAPHPLSALSEVLRNKRPFPQWFVSSSSAPFRPKLFLASRWWPMEMFCKWSTPTQERPVSGPQLQIFSLPKL